MVFIGSTPCLDTNHFQLTHQGMHAGTCSLLMSSTYQGMSGKPIYECTTQTEPTPCHSVLGDALCQSIHASLSKA